MAIVAGFDVHRAEPGRVSRRPGLLVPSVHERDISKLLLRLSRSNSDGGRSPSAWCSRLSLNQPMYSTTASSSCDRERQTRSAISSVLKLSTKLSARALS